MGSQEAPVDPDGRDETCPSHLPCAIGHPERGDLMSERHIHDWTRTGGAWTCRECPETSATCGTCDRASGSSLLICPACLRHTERLLDDIADALSHYVT